MAGTKKKVEMEVIALSHSISHVHSYTVVLGEVNGQHKLPIVIGGFEAQAIGVALEHMPTARPLTHDLMKNFMNAINVELMEVIITDLHEGIFYSKLVCISEHDTVEIDSRTSDAIALAVRFSCPIYAYENVLDTAGFMMQDTGREEGPSPKKRVTSDSQEDLSRLSITELNVLLNEILEKEDYIRAIAVRDEINKRKEP